MSQQLPHFFEHFFFEPLEGLNDVEQMFQELSDAYPWVHQALTVDRKGGWLRRGLLDSPVALWVDDFFSSVMGLFEHDEQERLRDIIATLAELLSALPLTFNKAPLFYALLSNLEWLEDEIDRGWALNSIVEAVAKQGEQDWSAGFFQEVIQLVRVFSSEEEQARVVRVLSGALGRLGRANWVPWRVESILSMIRSFRDTNCQQEAIQLVAEQFLGHERLRPELAHAPFLKHLAILVISVGATNNPAFRSAFGQRVVFVLRYIRGNMEVVSDSWEELLDVCHSLDMWTHEEFDLQGNLRWKVTPLPALLGWLGRDFNRAKNRGWVQQFFHKLCDQLFRLPPGVEREHAIRELIHGLIEGFQGNERETIAWIKHILQHADRIESNTSQIYEGIFQGFLEQLDLPRATVAATHIAQADLRDRAYHQLVKAWVEEEQPQRALTALYEMGDASIRGETALHLSLSSVVVQDPVACAMLFQATASLPAVSEEVLRNVVSHSDFPTEARQAILETSPVTPLSMFARNERLAELERLRSHLPDNIYLQERQSLLGLSEEEESNMTGKIAIDNPHRYGDSLYLTPREHVENNHFGEHVAGSRFSAWEDFSQMWKELSRTIEEKVKEDEGVQVIELEMPMDVGITGVMSLADAPPQQLSTEIRNGQPSLYCMAPEVRQPTRSVTVVVGPSVIGTDELEGYEGHNISCLLYTIYPGKPAYPFPRCGKDDYPKLETSLQAALSLLQAEQFEEAKAVLYETFSHMEGSEEAARYWSRNVLVH